MWKLHVFYSKKLWCPKGAVSTIGYYGRGDSTGGLWRVILVKVIEDGPRKRFGRQSLKKLIGHGRPKADHTPLNWL